MRRKPPTALNRPSMSFAPPCTLLSPCWPGQHARGWSSSRTCPTFCTQGRFLRWRSCRILPTPAPPPAPWDLRSSTACPSCTPASPRLARSASSAATPSPTPVTPCSGAWTWSRSASFAGCPFLFCSTPSFSKRRGRSSCQSAPLPFARLSCSWRHSLPTRRSARTASIPRHCSLRLARARNSLTPWSSRRPALPVPRLLPKFPVRKNALARVN
mmetsp:Transcript_2204/g.6835  ORF Transcript_2204/g.6835 Transcript_2204/m.6835 type:complete len:214 (+) Transcript_2204:1128-1769(+)